MTKQKRNFGLFLKFSAILLAACGWLFAAPAAAQQYQVSFFEDLGGINSRGNSINNKGWIAGYSNLSGDQTRHATLWRNGTPTDLGTLGSPERHSNVTWSVKNNNGLVVGISQTDTPEPLGQKFSCWAFFFPLPNNTGFVCRGFAWENGEMRELPTLGGHNSFATGANNRRQVVGWAENTFEDPTCEAGTQVLQFRPVVWELKRDQIQTRELPPYGGDTSGAATSINNKGQVVGISGICDQAVGRHTARHAVLWDKGEVINLGDLGAPWWNTPASINDRGDVVGFAGRPGDPEGNILRAFIWTRQGGIKPLNPLPNHVHSEAYGINERRQAVGTSCDENFVDCRAVLWENGEVKDLNMLIPTGGVYRLEHAKDINDRGEITGRAVRTNPTDRTAFRAVPAGDGNANNKGAQLKSAFLKDSGLRLFEPVGFDWAGFTR